MLNFCFVFIEFRYNLSIRDTIPGIKIFTKKKQKMKNIL